GWKDVQIFASGDLDEAKIGRLLKEGATIDAFGVGTALATPGDAPHLNLVYKLVEVERGGKTQEAAKFSRAKVTYPGRKQVLRYSNSAGDFTHDQIALENEPANGGQPLLAQVMRKGRRTQRAELVGELRARTFGNLGRLPEKYRRIERSAVYPVRHSKQLETMLENVRKRICNSAPK